AGRFSGGVWIGKETSLANSVTVSKRYYTREIFHRGFKFAVRPLTIEEPFEHFKTVRVVLTKVGFNNREELNWILHHYSKTIEYPGSQYASEYTWISSRKPKAQWVYGEHEGCLLGAYEQSTVIPDPPILPPRRKPVTCCPETQDKLDWIIAKTGLKKLPIEMEESITDDKDTSRDVDSVVEVLHLFIKHFMEIVGEFPVKLKIKTDEGEESDPIALENVSHFVREAYTMGFQILKDTDAGYSTGAATLGLLAQVIASVIRTHDLALANSEFMVYEANDAARDITLPFNPEANPGYSSQSELFTATKLQVKGMTMEDKQSISQHIKKVEYMLEILFNNVMETGSPDELLDKLEEYRAQVDSVLSEEKAQKDEQTLADRLEVLEEQINLYQEAKGLPKIKLSYRSKLD
ncbi:MAG: hypothetical protein ACFCBU_07890, partial [Cyanophyceae cyanobacterium]